MISKDELFKQCELFCKELQSEMEKALEHPDHDLNKNNYRCMSEKGRYLLKINKLMCKINELLGDLKKVLIFIRRFPDSKYFIDNGIDNIDYIKYHLEVLTNKAHNILEIMRLMINSTYELGLSTNECSWNNLKSKLDISSNTMQVINLYHKSFRDLIKLRHLIVHQGNDVDSVTTDMQSCLSLLRTECEYSGYFSREDKELQMSKMLLRFETKNYKKERIKYVKSVIHASEYYTDLFKYYIYKEAYKQAMLK